MHRLELGLCEDGHLDPHIDGRSLWRMLEPRSPEISLTPCLVHPVECRFADLQNTTVERLLLRVPSYFPDSRLGLYVCGHCGDPGCGTVSVRIERTSRTYVWRDFAYENTWQPPDFCFPGLGPFEFCSAQYRDALIRGARIFTGRPA